MKAKQPPSPDARVWCEHCCIRIAPSEDRIVEADKAYHPQCYPKPKPVKKTARKS